MAYVSTLAEHAAAERAPEPKAPRLGAGPVTERCPVRMPPARSLPRFAQTAQLLLRPLSFHLGARRELGDVWQIQLLNPKEPVVVTSHPDHAASLFRDKGEEAPSLAADSALRPIVGPNSVLTLTGDQHMRQRKLLLPPFHGNAVKRYVDLISEIIEREIGSWPVGRPFALAPRMQAVTLQVILRAIFGAERSTAPGSPGRRRLEMERKLLYATTHPLWQLVELRNAGRTEPRGLLRAAVALADRGLYAAIAARRADGIDDGEADILSLLLQARDEDGEPLSDNELRDELITLVLAGHETTANSLAWTFERLLRAPAAYAKLRELTRSESDGAEAYVDASIYEGMRVRPVVPLLGRMVKRPWRFGEFVVPANTRVAMSILALHHREDVYPDPHAFRPERFLDRRPGTYTWVGFGGGIRRCLGAELAMAEQRTVLRAIARRTDLAAVDTAPERARQRNVTMIPHRGARVVVRSKRSI
jgi:cytochrome P450